jgi:hypothetical protein
MASCRKVIRIGCDIMNLREMTQQDIQRKTHRCSIQAFLYFMAAFAFATTRKF